MNWQRRLFWRRRGERQLRDEIHAHLEEHVEDLLDRGVPAEEARAQARREFGNVTLKVEDSRRVWTPALLRLASSVMDDSRLAIRGLRARPVATVGAIVTLAGAIGTAAATWSLLSSVLLRALPIRDPKTLVVVALRYDSIGGRKSTSHTYPLYPAVRAASAFDGIAAGGSWNEVVEVGDALRPRDIFFASHDYFDTLGVQMALGREFSADDDRRGAPMTAVLSDRLWHTAFGGDTGVLNRTIRVHGNSALIIGVTPKGFRGLDLSKAPDLYLPLESVQNAATSLMNPFAEPSTSFSPTAWITIVGRLKPGIDGAQAAGRLNGLAMEEAQGGTFVVTDVSTAAIPEAARPDLARFMRLLGAAVGLLLLIGCLSVGMLLLIRTEARRDEFAMCLALGATRSRLARGVALEGAMLATAGAVLALPFCQWLSAGIRAFQLPGRISVDLLDLSMDERVVGAVAAAAMASTLIIALVAGAFGFSANVADALRARAGSTRLTRRGTRAALVIVQVAVAMVLVSGAGLFARSLVRALSLNPRYDTAHLVTSSIDLRAYGFDAGRATTFFGQLRDAIAVRPTIRSVSLSASEGGMSRGGRLAIDGQRRAMPSFTEFVGIDERYFSTIGLRPVRGRDFSERDVAGVPLVAIVSESLGRFVADGGNPIGHRIAEFFNRAGQPPDTIEIVGIVPDVITRVTTLEPLVLYLPLAQRRPSASRDLILRAANRNNVAIDDFLSAVRQLDRHVMPGRVLTMDDLMLQQMAPQQFGMLVLGALGAIAVLLTLLGTAVLAESMAILRKREMAVRAALGGSARQLGGLVLGETVRLVGIGLAVGLALTWFGAGTIRAFLFQVAPLDPTTLAAVPASILILALAVSLRPAIHVARLDLARVLREE